MLHLFSRQNEDSNHADGINIPYRKANDEKYKEGKYDRLTEPHQTNVTEFNCPCDP